MKLEKVCEVAEADRHHDDIETVIVRGSRVFTGADDGVIKIWSSSDLKAEHEFKAHEYAVNHLLIKNDRLYSASMDQTIKVWQIDSWKLIATLTDHEDTPRRLAEHGDFVFSGDDKGDVLKWTRDGQLTSKFEMVEEVWDLRVDGSHIYTIRDRGLTITETKDDTTQTSVVRTMEGRAPLHVTDSHLVMLAQSGTQINQHRNKTPAFEFVRQLQGHTSIVTVLAGWGDFLVSGGYDEKLCLWSLATGQLLASEPFAGCPTAAAATEAGEVFVAGPGTALRKVKAT